MTQQPQRIAKGTGPIANQYLARVSNRGTVVQVYLVTGTPVTGKIVNFDNESFVLRTKVREMLIYKSGVVSVQPKSIGAFDLVTPRKTDLVSKPKS